MIKTLFEKALKQAKNYKINDTKNLDMTELRHWAEVNNQKYCLAYGLLENIMFAIRKGECSDVKEIETFIDKYIDQTAIEPKIPIYLGDY